MHLLSKHSRSQINFFITITWVADNKNGYDSVKKDKKRNLLLLFLFYVINILNTYSIALDNFIYVIVAIFNLSLFKINM